MTDTDSSTILPEKEQYFRELKQTPALSIPALGLFLLGLAPIAFVFVFLPHYRCDISVQENEYQATTTRKGMEWLLTPLFVYQNYHLIHHLYPTTPFYNYMKIWHLKYDELTAHNPAIQTTFGLTPVNRERTLAETESPTAQAA
tara:strand:- start:9344 stop:9775 length:432 start_codon:yes stop_codon:yes gene_type:complete